MPARLEDLTPGTVVRGVVSGQPVTTVAAEWHGSSCVTLTFRTPGGDVGHQLVQRSEETGLDVEDAGRARAFDADGELFRLAAEARRIRLAQAIISELHHHGPQTLRRNQVLNTERGLNE